MRMTISALIAMSAACAPVPPADAETPVHGAGKCDAAKAQGLVGRSKSKALGAQALRLSGASTIRWIPEGGVVTMDYREDRLNIQLDGRKRVVTITCG
jgi:hypothetical protein